MWALWVHKVQMEDRMTLCNMVIEGGGKNGIVAADKTTMEYLQVCAPRACWYARAVGSLPHRSSCESASSLRILRGGLCCFFWFRVSHFNVLLLHHFPHPLLKRANLCSLEPEA